MASFDLYNLIHVVKSLSVTTISTNTTTNTDWIDTQESYGVMWTILSGTITDGTYTPLMQEADASDYSDAATVGSDFIIGTYAGATFASADDNVAKKIGYAGKKRYVRLVYTSTSVSSGGVLCATAQVGIPRHGPAA